MKVETNGKQIRETANGIVRLLDSTGRNVHFETHDGSTREGKVTSFTYRRLVLNGKNVLMPMEIELNGDIMDTIPLVQIAKLDID